MKRAIVLLALAASACGGGTQHTPVQEVPVDQESHGSSELPPDEIGGDAGTTTTAVPPDQSPPPGVGPQSLDTQATAAADAGAPQGFVQRQGGLTEKECTDVVLALAKLTAREKHTAAPTAADVQKDAMLTGLVNDCGAQTTKKQQKCGLAARTAGAWKKCME